MNEIKQFRWRKVLYEKQHVPDNYVDESFLEDLQKNINLKTYTIKEAICQTGVVSEEICSVVLFVVVFIYMDKGVLQPEHLLMYSTGIILLLYALFKLNNLRHLAAGNSRNSRTGLDDVKSAVFFVLFGFVLSPVLKTLTHTISTDTIYAMTSLMMFIHLIFHDYGISAPIVSSSLSLNAAFFSSICLASRLQTVEGAFVLLTFSVEIFALFPLFRKHVKTTYPQCGIAITIIMCITSFGALLTVSTSESLLFVLVVTFVNVICPVWFVNWQKYKENIYGPWDEAVVPAQPATPYGMQHS